MIVNGVTRQPAGTAILRRARASAQTTCAASLNDADNCWWEIRDPGTGTFDITPVGPGSYILYAGFDDLIAQTAVDVKDSPEGSSGGLPDLSLSQRRRWPWLAICLNRMTNACKTVKERST